MNSHIYFRTDAAFLLTAGFYSIYTNWTKSLTRQHWSATNLWTYDQYTARMHGAPTTPTQQHCYSRLSLERAQPTERVAVVTKQEKEFASSLRTSFLTSRVCAQMWIYVHGWVRGASGLYWREISRCSYCQPVYDHKHHVQRGREVGKIGVYSDIFWWNTICTSLVSLPTPILVDKQARASHITFSC